VTEARSTRDTPAQPHIRPSSRELGRRLVQLMVVRVTLITFALGVTVALHAAAPDELASANALWLFGMIGITYLLSIIYAVVLRRRGATRKFAALQVAGDLVVTTAIIHVSGGAQSGYAFFFLLSIVGAALIDYTRGALIATGASLLLYVLVCWLGWLGILGVPAGQHPSTAEMTAAELSRQLILNGAAFAAVGLLAGRLGSQLAAASVNLATQERRSADLAAQSADIIRCLSSGLVTIDKSGIVLTFNDAAEDITGIEAVKARGRSIGDLLPPVATLLEHLGDRAEVRRGEVRLARGRGERVLGVSISALTDHRDEPVGRILNFQDLTELRRMEGQVKRAERLAAVGQMAAGVAHEIRNPLASISGSVEILRQAPHIDPDHGTLMDIVVRECDRLNVLITELLDYASPRAPVQAPVDLGALLAETVRVFSQDRATGQVGVVFLPNSEPIEIQGDGDQLRQVVWNLLRNAAQASTGDSEVVLRLRRLPAYEPAPGESQMGVPPAGPWVELIVEDHGVGMSPGDRDRLFEPFFTTKARGTGLGLAMVHRIVTAHRGTIRVESAPGRGTRVTVRLPVSEQSADPDNGAAGSGQVITPMPELDTARIRAGKTS
jgi:two-component system sensor histidine kinase PilS (NtrC family)